MADYEKDFFDEKPMPRFKKPNSKFPKQDDEIDEDLEKAEQGNIKPNNLSKARKAMSGQKLSRPRLGGMTVGE